MLQDLIYVYLTFAMIVFTGGILAGFLAGLLGIGGGIIFVPLIYFIYLAFGATPTYAMALATGTSLCCMIPTSISAAYSQYKKGNIDLNLIKRWSFALSLGVIAGVLVSKYLGGSWLAVLFGVLLLLNALNTLFRAKAKPMFQSLPKNSFQNIIAFCISFFSVMLGVGGGTLTVPTLNACSFDPHKSIGTSSAVSLFVCIPGTIISLIASFEIHLAPIYTIGNISLILLALIAIPATITAPFGVMVGKRINSVMLKRIFAVALLIVSTNMLISAL